MTKITSICWPGKVGNMEQMESFVFEIMWYIRNGGKCCDCKGQLVEGNFCFPGKKFGKYSRKVFFPAVFISWLVITQIDITKITLYAICYRLLCNTQYRILKNKILIINLDIDCIFIFTFSPGGFVLDRLMSPDEMRNVAKVPSLQYVQGQLAGILSMASSRTYQLLQSNQQRLTSNLNQLVKQGNEEKQWRWCCKMDILWKFSLRSFSIGWDEAICPKIDWSAFKNKDTHRNLKALVFKYIQCQAYVSMESVLPSLTVQ